MTTLDPRTIPIPDLQQKLRGRLDSLARRVRVHVGIEGAAHVVIIAVATVILSYVLDRWLRLSLPLRLVCAAAAAAIFGVLIHRWIMQPLRTRLGPVDLSTALEQTGSTAATSLAQRVATVLELPNLLNAEAPPSRAMVETAVRSSATAVDGVNIEDRLDQHRLRLHAAVLAITLLVPVAVAWLAPVESGLWARRWLMASNQAYPQRTHLRVEGLVDGKMIVPRGEPCVLRVTMQPGSVEPDAVTLHLRDSRGHTERAAMNRFAPGDFRYDVPAVQEAMSFTIHGNDDDEGPFGVTPVDRPRLVEIVLDSQHPADKQPQHYTFSGHDADLSFFPQTQLELTLVANVPVSRIKLAGDHAPAAELRRIDDNRFIAAWTHKQATTMQVELVSRDGGLASVPTPITIGLKVDHPPRVTMRVTGVHQRVTPVARVPVTIEARDDGGLVELGVSTDVQAPPPEVSTTSTATPAIAPAPRRTTLLGPTRPAVDLEWLKKQTLELAPLRLAPGSVVTLTADASDDAYGGAQVGRSRPIPLRVVTAEELFREILMRLQQERARFRKTTEEAQAIATALQTAATTEAMAALSPRFQAVERESARVSTAFADALEEMRLNALGSPEAYTMMEQNILTPLNQLRDTAMAEQRVELKHLGQTLDAKRQTDAIAREGRIAEQMAAILKQMSQWDSFIDVLNQLNEVIRLEESVKERTEKLRQDQVKNLFEPEKH